jgi:hypothetical protein
MAESENDIILLSQLKYVEMPKLTKSLKNNLSELVKLQNRRMVKKQSVGKEDVVKIVSL